MNRAWEAVKAALAESPDATVREVWERTGLDLDYCSSAVPAARAGVGRPWTEEQREVARQRNKNRPRKTDEELGPAPAVDRALREGVLVRPETCPVCGGGGRIEGHHVDYSRPLDIRWVCCACHRAAHKLLKNGVDFDPEKIRLVRLYTKRGKALEGAV